jgi:hypothetical protein
MSVHVKTVTGDVYRLADQQDGLEKNWPNYRKTNHDGDLLAALTTIAGTNYANFPALPLTVEAPAGNRCFVNLAHVSEIWEELAPSDASA